MHRLILSTGTKPEVTDASYQSFAAPIGSGPRFVEVGLSSGERLLVNKDHIVLIAQ